VKFDKKNKPFQALQRFLNLVSVKYTGEANGFVKIVFEE
jgi:hypothetical protein